MSAGKKTPEPTTKRTASILIATVATVVSDLAYTGKTCSQCGQIGSRIKLRVVCDTCDRRTHSDVKAASNHARPGERSVSPRAAQNWPDVEETGNHVGL
jgi:transposase